MNLIGLIRLSLGFMAMAVPVFGQCISIPVSLEERTTAAEQIVLGRLKAKQAYWGPGQRQIYTLNIIEVNAYLKGSGGSEVALVTIGGFIGDRGQVTTPSLQVNYDNEYLLFLETAGPEMADEASTFRPDLEKMTAYADAQGALTKQAGFYHDLYSEPRRTEAGMFNRIANLTGFQALTPAGEVFQARDGITGIFDSFAAPITSITPNPTNAGTIANGDFVTINGSGFGAESTVFYANADDGGATFVGSGVASDNLSWSDSQIVNKPAASAGTGTVLVNGQTSTMTINYAHIAINSDFSGFPEVTRQRYNLADVDGNGGLTFQYNTSFAANTAAVAAFERSLETWRCEVLVNYGINTMSTTAIATAANDNTNVITFDASLPAGILGRATSYFSGSANGGCSLFNTVWWTEELDIQFKPNPPTPSTTWNYGPGATGFLEHDFESVSLHELGHALGLGHTIAPGTVMHFAISSGQDLRTPNANEIAGVNAKLAHSTTPFCFNPGGINGPMVLLSPGACAIISDDVDLQVSKTVTDMAPDEGEVITYTITVANLSANEATGVSLTDILPNGVTRTATPANPSQGNFNEGSGVWTIGTINGMANATLELEVTVDAGASSLGSIINTTSALTLDQTDPNSANNVGSVTINVSDNTDLAVTKMVNNDAPDEGDTLTYTITITNSGPARATNVSLIDMLPNGVTRTATAPNPSQGSFNDGTGLWTVGTLNNSQAVTLALEVTVDAGAASLSQPITNTTSGLMLNQTDTQSGNNVGSVGITVSDNTDLAVTKMVNNNAPDEGDTLIYTITITNNGPARATNVSLIDMLPNGVTRTATAPNPSQGSFNDGTGLWTVGTLDSSQAATLALEVTVDAGAASLSQPITNTTSGLMLNQTDTQSGNNVGSVGITVSDNTDLVVTKMVNNNAPAEGDTLTYSITVTNNGPARATNVSLIDMLPNGVTRTATAPNPSQGSFSDGTGLWTVGTIDSSQAATLALEVTVDAGAASLSQPITNTTSGLMLDQTDTQSGNNVGSVSITVSNNADLAVTKMASDSTPAEGDTLTYTITVNNHGPAQATNVSLIDMLPNGVTRTVTLPNASQGSFSDGTGLWMVGTLNSGNTATLELEVTIDAGASAISQPITNTTSSLGLDQPDPNNSNDIGMAAITVPNLTDLAVTKTVDEENPCQGDLIQFTITIFNNGPARATSVVLTDQLPTGLVRTATPSNASQGSFSDVSGIWSVGALENESMATLNFEVEVMGSGSITNNTSNLGLDQTDSDGSNNVGSVVIQASSPVTILTDPENRDACLGQSVNFSVVAGGGNLSYQWFKDGNLIVNATMATYSFTVNSQTDAGMYHCEVSNVCNTEPSQAAVLVVEGGSLSAAIDPSTAVRGLAPVVLTAIVDCAGPNVDLMWTNLNSGATFTDNPLVINDLIETTIFEVEVMDGDTLAMDTAEATVLVSQNPDFFDLNNDGCNNLLDMFLAIPDWNTAFPDDPNGDGWIDIRDLMHINVEDPFPCP